MIRGDLTHIYELMNCKDGLAFSLHTPSAPSISGLGTVSSNSILVISMVYCRKILNYPHPNIIGVPLAASTPSTNGRGALRGMSMICSMFQEDGERFPPKKNGMAGTPQNTSRLLCYGIIICVQ